MSVAVSPITAWSYSRLANWELCPAQFKYRHIDKLKEPPSPAMERGNVMHKALANFLTTPGESLPAFVTNPFQQKLYTEMQAFPDKIVEQQWGFTVGWEPTGWFAKGKNATWYRCSLDVALLYEDLTGEVVDHKSGKRYGTNDDQMEQFALSFMCQYKPAEHVTTRLVYLDGGEEEIAEFPAKDKEALKAKWTARAAAMLQDTTFVARPNDKCRFCHFSKSKQGPCRFG